jgi:hypothetical protein
LVPFVAVLGLVVVCSFAVVDSHYLREERLFRCLYNEARQANVEVFSMDKDKYTWACKRREVFRSWSVIGFYGPLAGAGIVALFWAWLR